MINPLKTTLKVGLIALTGLFSMNTAYAQFEDIGAFLRAGREDATILTREYLKPFPTGFGAGLNAGFTETAQPKKLFGFSLQIRSSVALVPDADQSFDISALNLQKIVVAPGENSFSPTISGKDVSGPELIIYDDPNSPTRTELGRFTMPEGAGVALVPAPTIQASVGLIKNTDFTLRYAPKTTVGDFGEFSIIGAAIKHDIKQWIPGAKLLPVDLSVLVGFNRISVDGNLDVQPSNPNAGDDFSGQTVETSTNTFVANAYVGKTLPFISVYGGVGYQKATFDLDIKGNYPVEALGGYTTINDPVSFSVESDASVHALAGFRIKLAFFAIYAEATFTDYVTANAGIGFTFR
ncbi:DUF6588 family protein [Balneola sp. MJW-20]|uniref:DUF6588 family protein n=1 Tax=Gracilimonas aurantiaca TaxID=3234185 RepID=UPI0034669641